MVYEWRPDTPEQLKDSDPQAVGESLIAIQRQNNGVLNLDLVVETAKDKNHVLHSLFTWDDTDAAHRYRKIEASRIARSLSVVVHRNAEYFDSRPVVVRKSVDACRPVRTAQQKEQDRYSEMRDRGLRELREWLNRYYLVAEFSDLVSVIEGSWPDQKGKIADVESAKVVLCH